MENFMEILRELSRDEETPDVNEREGSSGYASASSSLNSSRRSSNQSEIDEASGAVARREPAAVARRLEPSVVARRPAEPAVVASRPAEPAVAARRPAEPAVAARRPVEDNAPFDWASMFSAIGSAVAVGAAAYVAYKVAASGAQATLATTITQCEQQVEEIKKDALEFPVVGLDCQWKLSPFGAKSRRIAVLQLASQKGNVALIQLNKLSRIPQDLKNILYDRNIIKAGLETIKDAQYLLEDYGLEVRGTLDLRHLADDAGVFPGGLQRLSKDVLDLDIGRKWELISSDWEQENLSDDQIKYAETAVKASFDIFKELIGRLVRSPTPKVTLQYCQQYLDRRFIFHS